MLRQLRAGSPLRPKSFPQSLALIGVRDVRDYKVASGGSTRLGTASPFNIKIESLTLSNFTEEDVRELYQQHTSETGQFFTQTAIHRAFELTQGQPWLINALARQLVEVIVPDVAKDIEAEHVEQAKESLIRRKDTHLDSLVLLLQEERVRAVMEPMLAGQDLGSVPQDEVQFLLDLEILPRVLSETTQAALPQIQPSWLTEEGTLDADKLLSSFLAFWRQHGQPLLKSVAYHEIAPHIVMMAYLHRVVNGGGTLVREYAIGTDRMDLCLRYGDITIGMELKVWREGRKDPLEAGLAQLDRYLAGLGLSTGWLVIFDQRLGLEPISERTTVEKVRSVGDRDIVLIKG